MSDTQRTVAWFCVFAVACVLMTTIVVIADSLLESTLFAHPSRAWLAMIVGYWIARKVVG